MESTAARTLIPEVRLERIDGRALSIWALTGALVLYLAFSGGGYDLVIRNQVGVAVWWAVLVGAGTGLFPLARLGRRAWVGLGLFAAFLAWSGVAWSSSYSPGRSLDEVSRVACYVGVFVLALAVHRDREHALRHTIAALATAIVVVAAVAVLSRLRPGTFAAAAQTASFLPGTQGRLAWPLNYWNALAALMALGLPLVLAMAGSARRLVVQAAAAAAVPLLALCAYLTFSRGGAIATAGAVLTYYALTEGRVQKLATGFVAAGGSAVLIAGAVHRSAIENGLTGAAARHQGASELVAIVLVCAATGIMQVGIGLAARHGTLPRPLRISPGWARGLLAAAVTVAVVLALLAGGTTKLSHAWNNFKRPTSASLHQDSLARFGSTSGNQRYDYWKVSWHQSAAHPLTGWGPGTWQFVWLSHAPYANGYVRDAHSLYFETLVEDGAVGLGLLVAFLLAVTAAAVRVVTRVRHEARVRAAGAAAACVAFVLSAAFDWIWQVPVLPVAFLLLAAAVLVPGRPPRPAGGARRTAGRLARGVALRVAGVAASVACLAAIGVALASTSALRASQVAAAAGDTSTALTQALTAERIDPAAGDPKLQLALVYELRHQLEPAVQAVRGATSADPLNWSTWLVRSRLEAETGNPSAAVRAFVRARSLNPYSSVFAP